MPPFDINQLLQMLPQLGGALKGGPEGAALMEGFRRGQQMRQQEEMRKQQMGRQSMLDDSMLQRQSRLDEMTRENQQADNTRADEQHELAKFQQMLTQFDKFSTTQGETAWDPLEAQNANVVRKFQLEQGAGLAPGQLGSQLPNMTAAISPRKKKLAREMWEDAKKIYDPNPEKPDPGWEDRVTIKTGEAFGDVHPSALRAMFETPAVGPDGQPAQRPKPYVKPPNDGVPTTERITLAAFARERGKTPDTLSTADLLAFRKQYQQVDDRPPLNITVGGSGLSRDQVGAAAGLRDDYRAESKDFTTVRSAHDRVIASASDPSAAGDMALLFNYMKILDPNSVVRETEFRTAAQSGSLPQQVQAAASKVVNGQRLTPEQRADFVARAKGLFAAADKRQRRLAARYRDIATKSGVPADLVVIDTGDLDVPDPADAPAAPVVPAAGTKIGRFEVIR